MEKSLCLTCQSSQTTLRCGLCNDPCCKTCAHLMDADAFSFLPERAATLKHDVYCHSCYSKDVEPQVERYDSTMAAARDVDVYFKDQGKETRLLERIDQKGYRIPACEDRDELVLRLAFLAALDGYKMIVDVDIQHQKIRTGTYQTTNWSGSAVPANPRSAPAPKRPR